MILDSSSLGYENGMNVVVLNNGAHKHEIKILQPLFLRMIIGSCELQKKRGMFEERISFKIIVLRLPKKENNKKLSQ